MVRSTGGNIRSRKAAKSTIQNYLIIIYAGRRQPPSPGTSANTLKDTRYEYLPDVPGFMFWKYCFRWHEAKYEKLEKHC